MSDFSAAVLRNAKRRDQNPTLKKIVVESLFSVGPSLLNLRIGLRKREWQEHWARESAWRLAKKILKEKHKGAFFSPTEKWSLPSPSKN